MNAAVILSGVMPFELNSKQLFLTYPQCNLSKEDAYERLQEKIQGIELIVVAHEKHQNGDDHLHVYIKLKESLRTKDNRFFDLGEFHGNYQGCRSSKNVLKYCTKMEDYCANFDVGEVLAKRGSKKRITAQKLLSGKTLLEVCEDEPEIIIDYKRIKENFEAYKRDIELLKEETDLICEVPNPWGIRAMVDTDVKKCHFWFWSKCSNKGKTTGVINPLIGDHDAYLLHPQNQYHSIRETQKIIVIDELYRGGIKAQYLNTICDGHADFRIFMGGYIRLKTKPLVIVCSNFSIRDVFPVMWEFVFSRFNEYEVTNL